jgi:hypothetical protein
MLNGVSVQYYCKVMVVIAIAMIVVVWAVPETLFSRFQTAVPP